MADENTKNGPDEIPDVPTKSDKPPRPSDRPPSPAKVAADPTLNPGEKKPPVERVRDELEGPKHPALFLAEFESPAQVLKAAETLRDAGYQEFDVHTPFPVHGMDKAMGLKETPIGLIAFGGGLTGTIVAYLMMWWMNGFDYPLVVGGKPPESIPSMIPIMFELTILLCAFGTFFGLMGLCKLPRHHHPVFYSDHFKSFSDDKYWVSVEANDPKFDLKKTRALLDGLSPRHIELVEETLP